MHNSQCIIKHTPPCFADLLELIGGIKNITLILSFLFPYSLFPVPYSLFPIPCSLFPVPYSLFIIPCSLFPVPCSLFPVPYLRSLLHKYVNHFSHTGFKIIKLRQLIMYNGESNIHHQTFFIQRSYKFMFLQAITFTN